MNSQKKHSGLFCFLSKKETNIIFSISDVYLDVNSYFQVNTHSMLFLKPIDK